MIDIKRQIESAYLKGKSAHEKWRERVERERMQAQLEREIRQQLAMGGQEDARET